MNRYIIYAAGGTLVVHYLGGAWYIGTIAGLIAAILLAPSTGNKRVIIEDVTTGKIEIQPNDRATQRYIAGRGE
jgi:hypothetical protein